MMQVAYDHERPQKCFQRGANPEASEGRQAYLSSAYLWKTNTCCSSISLCRKEIDGVSVSDTVHG